MKRFFLVSTFLLLIAALPDLVGELDIRRVAAISGELGTYAGTEIEGLGTSSFADDEASGCATGNAAAAPEASRTNSHSATAFGVPVVRYPGLRIGPIAADRKD